MKITSQSSVLKPLTSAEGCVPCCSGPQSFGIPGVRDQPERRHVNPEVSAIGKTSPKDKFKRGVEYTRRLAQEWWQEWLNTCLHPLQARQKWRNVQRNFQLGDLVFLIDPTVPSVGRHPYAIVIDVKKCIDGLVRALTVRMADGRTRERDISKLVLIEAANHKRNETKPDDDRDCASKTEAREECIGAFNIHDNNYKEEDDVISNDESATMNFAEEKRDAESGTKEDIEYGCGKDCGIEYVYGEDRGVEYDCG